MRAVRPRHRAVLIGKQRHRQLVLVDEALMRLDALRRDAHYRRALGGELVRPIPVRAKLCFTNRRAVALLAVCRDIESGAYISHSLRSELGDPFDEALRRDPTTVAPSAANSSGRLRYEQTVLHKRACRLRRARQCVALCMA
jgi:hypothetical protein